MSTFPLPPPPGVELAQDRRLTIVVPSAMLWVLAAVSVAMRLGSRRIQGVPLWIDDWLILASLPISLVALVFMSGYAVSHGLGRHIWVASPDALEALTLGIFIFQISCLTVILCVKCSLLAFFWRCFSIKKSIRAPIWVLTTVVLLWYIACVVVTLLECQPVSAIWKRFHIPSPPPSSVYRCDVDLTLFYKASIIPTIVTDIIMLLLPAIYVWNARVSMAQKIAICSTFIVGITSTIASVVRLQYLLKVDQHDVDLTWTFVDSTLWAFIEISLGIFCACLPFLRPTMNKLGLGFSRITNTYRGNEQTHKGKRHTNTPQRQRRDKQGSIYWGDERRLGGINMAALSSKSRQEEGEEGDQTLLYSFEEIEHRIDGKITDVAGWSIKSQELPRSLDISLSGNMATVVHVKSEPLEPGNIL